MLLGSIRRMMIAIAVLGVVLGGLLGLSRMLAMRTAVPRDSCQSRLRSVLLAMLGYANQEGHFPAGTWPNPGLPPEKRLSFYAAILPYLDNIELWETTRKEAAWDDAVNAEVCQTCISSLYCPRSPLGSKASSHPTTYIGIAGLGVDAPTLPKGHPRAGIFGYDRRTTLNDLRDGASTTMVLAESGRMRGTWLSGGPATVRGLDTADLPYIGMGQQFGGLDSPTGANVAFADGSIRFIPDTINPRVFEALSTIAGGEAVPPQPW